MVAAGVHNPCVPCLPQDIATLQARFDLALERTVIIEQCQENPALRPGCDPVHIFDFLDGMRLIVSFDRFMAMPELLHVSASFPPNSPLAARLALIPIPSLRLPAFIGMVVEQADELARRKVNLKLVQISEGGVPHFFGPTRQEFEKLAVRP